MVLAIFQFRIKSLPKFLEYAEGHRSTVAQHGGRILFESHDLETLEGNWIPAVVVVQEWATVEAFKKWYNSKTYQPWRALQTEAADVQLVTGVARHNPVC
jgi:uncharacterized protein (DUF1330 family)